MSESLQASKPNVPKNVIQLKSDGSYVGTRAAAAAARERILTVVRSGAVAKVDAEGVAVMTPAFADISLGEVLTTLGEEVFTKSVRVVNCNETCTALIEAVLQHRAGPGPVEEDEEAPVETDSEEE